MWESGFRASELFRLDSDSDSELESKNPDSDSGKKGAFGFESGFRLALLPDGSFYGQLDSNPYSDSKQLDPDLDLDSRKKGWIRIQLHSDSTCLDSGPDLDSRCLDSHITAS